MDIESPGKGVMAQTGSGEMERIACRRKSGRGRRSALSSCARCPTVGWSERDSGMVVLPTAAFWQEPVVEPGERVQKKQLLGQVVSRTSTSRPMSGSSPALVFVAGIMMGIGKAAVYQA